MYCYQWQSVPCERRIRVLMQADASRSSSPVKSVDVSAGSQSAARHTRLLAASAVNVMCERRAIIVCVAGIRV